MKAIIMAGGNGSRLYPLSKISSKQLQAVYDKPMIYYPLTVLIASGICEFCIITTEHDLPHFKRLLEDGSQLGISIEYRIQEKPAGIAQAFLIAESFIENDNIALMLGDNIFFGGSAFPNAMTEFKSGATIFAYQVKNPSDFGVIEFDLNGKALTIEEKPKIPRSQFAVPGLYLYDNQVVKIAKNLKPSARGELEITDINREYLEMGELNVRRLSRGFVWLDVGTSGALQEASNYIEIIERRQGVKLGCPEEAAFVRGFLSQSDIQRIAGAMPGCEYRSYLERTLAEAQRSNETD